jgi:hypothetical protein
MRRDHAAVLSPVLVATVVYLAAVAFLVASGSEDTSEAFAAAIRSPDVAVWATIVAAQVALWACVMVPAYRRAVLYAQEARKHPLLLTIDGVVLLLLLVVFLWGHHGLDPNWQLAVVSQKPKVAALNIFGFVVLAPCLLGMRLVGLAAENLLASQTPALDRFSEFRADLRWFLVTAGWIIGAATLATGALRNVIIGLNPSAKIPASAILLYGGFCSGLLALFYLPSFEMFSRCGRRLIEIYVPLSANDAAAWLEAHEKKLKLAEALGVGTTGVQAFQEGAAIVAPLVASAVGLLLGTK